jgi:hypothetical protein
MINPEILESFVPWLNEKTSFDQTFEDRGIKKDAPQAAKDGFEKYLMLEKEAKKQGKPI